MNPFRTRRRRALLALTLTLAVFGQQSGVTAQQASSIVKPTSEPMTTINAQQLQAMLGATMNTVVAQARAQGVSEAKIAQLQAQLGGMMQQATALVQQGGDGGVQVPTRALQALSMNMQQGLSGGGMSAQGMTAQDGLGDLLPSVPSFLNGGLDSIVDYLIDGLSTVISAIPFIGPPLAKIVSSVGASLKSFLINNALAGIVGDALSQALSYYKQVQDLLGMADINTLLGSGSNLVADRLNGFLKNNTALPNGAVAGGQTDPKQITAAVNTATNGVADGVASDLKTLDNDPYFDTTGYSKYTNPNTASTEISSMLTRMQAGQAQAGLINTTGQSLQAIAVADQIAGQSADRVGSVQTQGEIAKAGVAQATSELGATQMQSNLIIQGNNLNAMNAAATHQLLKQQIMQGDANLQATTALVQKNVDDARAAAEEMNRIQKETQQGNIAAANQAAASIASVANISVLGKLDATAHPLPGPYGEAPFFP